MYCQGRRHWVELGGHVHPTCTCMCSFPSLTKIQWSFTLLFARWGHKCWQFSLEYLAKPCFFSFTFLPHLTSKYISLRNTIIITCDFSLFFAFAHILSFEISYLKVVNRQGDIWSWIGRFGTEGYPARVPRTESFFCCFKWGPYIDIFMFSVQLYAKVSFSLHIWG